MKKIQSDIVNIENISDRDRESGTVLHKQKRFFFSVKIATIFQKIAKFRQNVYNFVEHYYSFDRFFLSLCKNCSLLRGWSNPVCAHNFFLKILIPILI